MPLYDTFRVSSMGFLPLLFFFSLHVFVWVIHSASFALCNENVLYHLDYFFSESLL